MDPRDDSKNRWILEWYRFDPERNERRYVPIAAYTRKREFNRAFRELGKELEARKATGLSEEVEHVTGVQHHKGYLAEVRRMRERDRQIRQSRKESPPSSA